MMGYEEIMQRHRRQQVQARGLIQPEDVKGVKTEVGCICPNCDHKFNVIIVLTEMRINLLAPRYDKKAA